ncbi:hypothetical protein ALQ48_03473 [Pseudomonas coronafaciens pv. zizaniae]|nr:hypothetical protein ALQ48_03473 [Pseudomonas coronafaciens pv. zizaniae]
MTPWCKDLWERQESEDQARQTSSIFKNPDVARMPVVHGLKTAA